MTIHDLLSPPAQTPTVKSRHHFSKSPFCILPTPIDIVGCMQFQRIWVQQCRATRSIKRRFGVKSALDYLVGEKLLNFAAAAEQHSEFAAELPRFQAAVWKVFNPYELAGYLTSLKPSTRKKLQNLLYVNCGSRSRWSS
jgi:hypothetical protein